MVEIFIDRGRSMSKLSATNEMALNCVIIRTSIVSRTDPISEDASSSSNVALRRARKRNREEKK